MRYQAWALSLCAPVPAEGGCRDRLVVFYGHDDDDAPLVTTVAQGCDDDAPVWRERRVSGDRWCPECCVPWDWCSEQYSHREGWTS